MASGTGTGTHRLRSALVVAEVAVAFLLLTGSGLLIRSFFEMQQADTGFNSDNVLTARLPISDKQFPHPDQLTCLSPANRGRISRAFRAFGVSR